MTGVFIIEKREGDRDRHIQREDDPLKEAKNNKPGSAKDCWHPPEARKRQDRILS